MFHNDSILNILGIKDKNIKVISVEEAEQTNHSVKEYLTLIKTTLSYPINRCRNSDFPTVNTDGFRKTHVRLTSLNRRKYELELRKRRYKCKSCHTTFGAITDLTKENQTLSSDLKNQIILLARKALAGQLIAEMCHYFPSSVYRTILERMEPHYRVAKLPKHLCFDEFRSTKSVMPFICCDAETHQIVTRLQDRLFPNANIIIDRFHIAQLVGRALDNYCVSLLKSLDNHSREYKIMKSHWKLFHKKLKNFNQKK